MALLSSLAERAACPWDLTLTSTQSYQVLLYFFSIWPKSWSRCEWSNEYDALFVLIAISQSLTLKLKKKNNLSAGLLF